MTNSWRALARMARDRLVASDPTDLTLVLGVGFSKAPLFHHGDNNRFYLALASAPVMSCSSTPL